MTSQPRPQFQQSLETALRNYRIAFRCDEQTVANLRSQAYLVLGRGFNDLAVRVLPLAGIAYRVEEAIFIIGRTYSFGRQAEHQLDQVIEQIIAVHTKWLVRIWLNPGLGYVRRTRRSVAHDLTQVFNFYYPRASLRQWLAEAAQQALASETPPPLSNSTAPSVKFAPETEALLARLTPPFKDQAKAIAFTRARLQDLQRLNLKLSEAWLVAVAVLAGHLQTQQTTRAVVGLESWQDYLANLSVPIAKQLQSELGGDPVELESDLVDLLHMYFPHLYFPHLA
jgi:hypothetical protein